jgi:hypothetical protein
MKEFLENPESTPSEGICPTRKLFETLKLLSFFNCPSEAGIGPLRVLLDMSQEFRYN